MNELFLGIVNRSISASWLVLAVLLLRFVLKKAPKWVRVLLWGIVAIRLICPFSFESKLSLVPSAETIPLNIGMDTAPTINSGINVINNAVNPVISQSNAPMVGASVNPLQITIFICEFIWIFGMILLALYAAISYGRLRRRLAAAVRCKDNIFQSENVSAPFVLGIVKPRIYLPFKLDGQNLKHVVAHEQAHIDRRDHWWKPLGFLLLTIHWFNPLMWLAYALLCRDIELACDEKVIQSLDSGQRADYTQALVACSVNRRVVTACPLAFGEVGVKNRVKSVMNYKKPAVWVMVLAVIACVVAAVCFLTDPAGTALTKWTIDEVDMRAVLSDVRSMTVRYYGDSVSCSQEDSSRFISTMEKIKIGRFPASQRRIEAENASFSIWFNDNLSLNFAEDFSEIWVDNGVKPSFCYPIANPETAEELLLDYHFARNGVDGGSTAEKWQNQLEVPEGASEDGSSEISFSERSGEENLVECFKNSMADSGKLTVTDYVYAEDGAFGLYGVVQYTDETETPWKLAFIRDGAVLPTGQSWGADCVAVSRLSYVGDGVVQVYIEDQSTGSFYRCRMGYSWDAEAGATNFTSASEKVDPAELSTE